MFSRTSLPALALLVAACSDDLPTGMKPSSTPATITIQSGDGQTAVVVRSLADPLVVRVDDARGRPVRNASVWFEIVSGGGLIVGRSSLLTDSLGLARATWRLGQSTADEQVAKAHVMKASGSPAGADVTFHANSLPDRPWSIEIPMPGGTIEAAAEFTGTVVARVYDHYRNPVPGTAVQWSAPMAGTLGETETVTGADGSTETSWTIRASEGSELGAGAYWVTAAIQGIGSTEPATAIHTITVGDGRLAATSLAVGAKHSCAVADAQVYCWGDNASGQLGDGNGERASRPFAVRVDVGGESFAQVVAGFAHTCALSTTGLTYCWGANSEGQLGDGTRAVRSTPVPVEQPGTFVSLTAGTSHTCGLTNTGTAYCWGSNLDGELGDGSTIARTVPNEVVGGERFASLTAGPDHTCGLTVDERALCWGNDDAGQVGTTLTDSPCRARCVNTPSPVDGRFIALSAGMHYTCGVERAGTAWCWGGNLASRTKVDASVTFTDLVAGRGSDVCGLTEEGRAYCWAFIYDDYYYYYGNTVLSTPAPIGGARLFSVLRLGETLACGLERDETGRVVCWSAAAPNAMGRTEPTYVLRAGRP